MYFEEKRHIGISYLATRPDIRKYRGGFYSFYYLSKSLRTRVKHMQPQKETLTDSLADIIQILHIGFRSGTLMVERGENQMLEEGYLIFVNGRVVDARVGQYTNWSAFNYLKTWGNCRFSFDSDAPTSLTSAPSSLPMNTNGYSNGNTNGHTDASGQINGYALRESMAITPPGLPPNPYGNLSGPLSRVPTRLQAGEAALLHPDSTGIQRTHRRLLLLVNGQRNRDELARLMSRNPDEVQVLLDDLEQAGFIHQ
jgi:hypothetical protein